MNAECLQSGPASLHHEAHYQCCNLAECFFDLMQTVLITKHNARPSLKIKNTGKAENIASNEAVIR